MNSLSLSLLIEDMIHARDDFKSLAFDFMLL